MINGSHVLIYSDDPTATRAFFRDVLRLPYVDAHDGWLILKLPPSEVGSHPVAPSGPRAGEHFLSLMCDDLDATVAELTDRGAEFTAGIDDTGIGRITMLRLPGAGELMLYQPSHLIAYNLPD